MHKYRCKKCEAAVKVKTARLPRGWKDIGGPMCGDCLASSYCLRSVTLPVVAPIGNHTWQDVNPHITAAFQLSTSLANWAVHHLFRRDIPNQVQAPDAVKPGNKGEPHKCYLYGAAAQAYPGWSTLTDGAASSAQCVFRAVHTKYLQDRFAIMFRHDSSLLTYRYPYPYPVHNASWSIEYRTGPWPGEAPCVGIPLPQIGRVWFRLDRGPEFGRQLAMLRTLHDGKAVRGEAALYRNRKGQLLVKFVGHFPRVERESTPLHACLLRTDPAALLVGEIDGRSPWILNCDHLKRWQAAHRAYLQRCSEDLKREKRMDASQRKNFSKARQLRCDKHSNRMGTAVHQITAQVARFCERQRVGAVIFDDSNREFIPEGFPWHSLQERLAYKLDGIGVVLVCSRNLDPKEREEWLSNRTLARALSLAGTRLIAGVRRGKSNPAVTPNPGVGNSSGSRSQPSRKSSPTASASPSGKRSRRTRSSAA